MRIILGSTSEHKFSAVREACEKLGIKAEIHGIEAPSGQNAQPEGFSETYLGAFSRALFAKDNNPGEFVYIGIESGIISIHAASLDIAVIVVLTGNDHIVTTSAGTPFPHDCLAIACHRGFITTTAGSVIAEKLGCDPTDPHSVLTHGKVSRKDTLVQALMIALSQM